MQPDIENMEVAEFKCFVLISKNCDTFVARTFEKQFNFLLIYPVWYTKSLHPFSQDFPHKLIWPRFVMSTAIFSLWLTILIRFRISIKYNYAAKLSHKEEVRMRCVFSPEKKSLSAICNPVVSVWSQIPV